MDRLFPHPLKVELDFTDARLASHRRGSNVWIVPPRLRNAQKGGQPGDSYLQEAPEQQAEPDDKREGRPPAQGDAGQGEQHRRDQRPLRVRLLRPLQGCPAVQGRHPVRLLVWFNKKLLNEKWYDLPVMEICIDGGDHEKVAEVIERTLRSKPAKATHWSTALMAEETQLNAMAVSRIWRAFGLKPRRLETFKLSTGPLFVDKVHDIVGLCMNSPDKAMVLCVDERSRIQALNRTQPALPLFFGRCEARTHAYLRHGTTTLFAALDVATGKVIGRLHRRHRAKEVLAFPNAIDEEAPKELDVHVIWRRTADQIIDSIARLSDKLNRNANFC